MGGGGGGGGGDYVMQVKFACIIQGRAHPMQFLKPPSSIAMLYRKCLTASTCSRYTINLLNNSYVK